MFAEHVSASKPRVISRGATAHVILAWGTNPDADNFHSVEFIAHNKEGWRLGTLDFHAGSASVVDRTEQCRSCHVGDKPLWAGYNEWPGHVSSWGQVQRYVYTWNARLRLPNVMRGTDGALRDVNPKSGEFIWPTYKRFSTSHATMNSSLGFLLIEELMSSNAAVAEFMENRINDTDVDPVEQWELHYPAGENTSAEEHASSYELLYRTKGDDYIGARKRTLLYSNALSTSVRLASGMRQGICTILRQGTLSRVRIRLREKPAACRIPSVPGLSSTGAQTGTCHDWMPFTFWGASGWCCELAACLGEEEGQFLGRKLRV